MRAHENPFRAECIEALAFRARGRSVDELLAQLDAQDGRGALVGSKGSGKTTLLLALEQRLRQRGVVCRAIRLNTGDHTMDWKLLETLPPGASLLLDGAEQLSAWSWRRVRRATRTAPYLVTTSHKRAHLPLLHQHIVTPELLAELVDELLEGCPPPTDLHQLYATHKGNIRECFHTLYEIVANS